MKIHNRSHLTSRAGFTLAEVMVAMTIVIVVLGLSMSTFIFSLRIMYKDIQRLASNASLRSFMSQIANETLNSSYYYLFPYYTALDGNVDLTADPSVRTQSFNSATDIYDEWVAHGDCLVLVTLTSQYRSTDIRQIRIYYRLTKDQSTTAGENLNAEAPLRYYETTDWGEGPAPTSPITVGATNGHALGTNSAGLITELNLINLKITPTLAGSKLLNARSLGRFRVTPATDRYPIFSTLSPTAGPTSGSISINVEFLNGTSATNMLSSSSFNYTISPRK